MFKPVSGSDLANFDQETRNLYARRASDPRLTHALLTLPRTSRHHLPVVASPDNASVKKFTDDASKFPY